MRRCATCGHNRDCHLHYRRGTDCGVCPCPQFRGRLAAFLRRLCPCGAC